MIRRPPRSPFFPYPPLFRFSGREPAASVADADLGAGGSEKGTLGGGVPERGDGAPSARLNHRDRKSTRLNSSHANISYAVFCFKKKKEKKLTDKNDTQDHSD